jgi:hypothetical protein
MLSCCRTLYNLLVQLIRTNLILLNNNYSVNPPNPLFCNSWKSFRVQKDVKFWNTENNFYYKFLNFHYIPVLHKCMNRNYFVFTPLQYPYFHPCVHCHVFYTCIYAFTCSKFNTFAPTSKVGYALSPSRHTRIPREGMLKISGFCLPQVKRNVPWNMCFVPQWLL